jgi:hypothetical protein
MLIILKESYLMFLLIQIAKKWFIFSLFIKFVYRIYFYTLPCCTSTHLKFIQFSNSNIMILKIWTISPLNQETEAKSDKIH